MYKNFEFVCALLYKSSFSYFLPLLKSVQWAASLHFSIPLIDDRLEQHNSGAFFSLLVATNFYIYYFFSFLGTFFQSKLKKALDSSSNKICWLGSTNSSFACSSALLQNLPLLLLVFHICIQTPQQLCICKRFFSYLHSLRFVSSFWSSQFSFLSIAIVLSQ